MTHTYKITGWLLDGRNKRIVNDTIDLDYRLEDAADIQDEINMYLVRWAMVLQEPIDASEFTLELVR